MPEVFQRCPIRSISALQRDARRLLLVVAALPMAAPASAGGAGEPDVEARSAGIRYGQAVGAAATCAHVVLMPAAAALAQRFESNARQSFRDEAERVARAWARSLDCKTAADINRCRILSEKSCNEALREIGPEGIAIPGLIEFRR
jgi:hypothetical protein